MASLIQRSNGYFYFVTYLRGKRVWQSTGEKTKSGALCFLGDKKRRSRQSKNLILSQFRTQYISFAKANLAPSTATLYDGAISTFLKYAGDLLLSDYTPQIIEQLLSSN
jgi:hypothetical protein